MSRPEPRDPRATGGDGATAPITATVIATADPPPPGIPNPVHEANGARAAGYRAPLVAGVRTYGWAVEAILVAAGPAWLDDGWIDFQLCRPVFAGEHLVTTVTPAGSGWSVSTVVEPGRVVLEGALGLGAAPWLGELDPPPAAPGEEPPPIRPTYDVATAPVGEPLRPLSDYVSGAAAVAMITADLGLDEVPFCQGERCRLHPSPLAGRMAPLTRHNFTYGPTIHVRSQIQHRGPAWADQRITVGARIVEVYERNGHSYQVLDGRVSDEEERDVALIRHHTIFRPRGTQAPEPTRAPAA